MVVVTRAGHLREWSQRELRLFIIYDFIVLRPFPFSCFISFKPFPINLSFRQEILLATAAREPQPDYRSRTNHDLMLVIEDQWRKQLHQEQEQEEEDRRREEATRVENIVMKDGRRSREGKDGEGRGVEEAKERMEGRRSRQEVIQFGKMGRMEDGVGSEVEKGRVEGRRSKKEEVVMEG